MQIIDNGVATQLDKTEYYEFVADPSEVMVFHGQAGVQISDRKWETLKSHQEMALAQGTHRKVSEFNAHSDDDLYNLELPVLTATGGSK